jgi:sulfur carrier protein ThiS
MKIILNRKEITLKLETKKKVKDVFSLLKLNPVSYIVIDRNKNLLLTPDDFVDDSSFLEIRNVISGG